MRILLDETGLISNSDPTFTCGRSISCTDNWGCEGGVGGIFCG